MNVFVTGGSGFLGRHVVDELTSRGHVVAAPSRAELDLIDGDLLAKALQRCEPDVVVHLASSLAKNDDAAQMRDTFEAGRTLVRTAVDVGVRKFVIAGSLDEVGGVEGIVAPYEPLCPGTVYGLAKALLLEAVRFEARRHELAVQWARPTIIYGPGQEGTMLVPAAFRAAVAGERAEFSSGEQQRDFIYVADVARWFADAVEVRDEPGVRIHHVGSGTPIAVREVLKKIEAHSSEPFAIGALPMRPGETPLLGVAPYVCPLQPLSRWTADTTLDEGIEQTWQWWVKR